MACARSLAERIQISVISDSGSFNYPVDNRLLNE
jgi:hypothetical protein